MAFNRGPSPGGGRRTPPGNPIPGWPPLRWKARRPRRSPRGSRQSWTPGRAEHECVNKMIWCCPPRPGLLRRIVALTGDPRVRGALPPGTEPPGDREPADRGRRSRKRRRRPVPRAPRRPAQVLPPGSLRPGRCRWSSVNLRAAVCSQRTGTGPQAVIDVARLAFGRPRPSGRTTRGARCGRHDLVSPVVGQEVDSRAWHQGREAAIRPARARRIPTSAGSKGRARRGTAAGRARRGDRSPVEAFRIRAPAASATGACRQRGPRRAPARGSRPGRGSRAWSSARAAPRRR